MNTENRAIMSYRLMAILALVVGMLGIAFQFLPDFGLLSFMLTIAVLGGLIGGSSSYEQRDRQRLEHSYQKAFAGLLLVVMAAYALIEISRYFNFGEIAAAFLNAHWPGLILSVMCLALGIAGLQKEKSSGSA